MREFNTYLTKPQTERLAILMEECAEVQQVIGKILRHGYTSYNPNDITETPNYRLLEKELGHVFYAVALMQQNEDLNRDHIIECREEKEINIKRYLHFQQTESED